jgi:hypothetical protein
MTAWHKEMTTAAVKKLLDGTPYVSGVVHSNLFDGSAVSWYEGGIHVTVVFRQYARTKTRSICVVDAFDGKQPAKTISRIISNKTPDEAVIKMIANMVKSAVGSIRQTQISELVDFARELRG